MFVLRPAFGCLGQLVILGILIYLFFLLSWHYGAFKTSVKVAFWWMFP